MEFNIEIRKKQLQSLNQYIKSSEDNVQAVLQSLGWSTRKTLEKDDPKIVCPINKNHLISFKTAQEHEEKCKLHCLGYDSNEEFLSEPPEDVAGSIRLDNKKKIEILSAARSSRSDFKTAWNGRDPDAKTSNRLTSTFSGDERLAIYDYTIKHTEPPPKPEEFTLDIPDTSHKKELTDKEKQALERDTKRRRAKYKSVHTSKKSQTEIMKEVIDNQMELYQQWIEQKQKQERKEKREKQRRVEENAKKIETDGDKTQYHYIETTYDQHIATPVENASQWSELATQYGGSQYYNTSQQNQGVITDWSHIYQGGIDTEVFNDLGQYQFGSTQYDNSACLSYADTSAVQNVNGTQYSNGNGVDSFKDVPRIKEQEQIYSVYEEQRIKDSRKERR